jgi:hypothetical protein
MVGMSDVTYNVKCPNCSGKAVAHMRPSGRRGTYREVFIKMGMRRIVCEACGFFREVPPEECDDYELWYATYFKGYRLWARNRRHLAFLTSWVSGNRARNAADRCSVEDFPKWMILAKNRAGILKCLTEMNNKDANKRGGGNGGTARLRRARRLAPAAPHHGR